MEFSSEKRRFERLSVGPEYRVFMEFQGREIRGARLQNISACGCGVQVPRSEAQGFEPGLRIHPLQLLHPELPCVPLEALIIRVLGRTTGSQDGYVLLGLDFVYVSPTVEKLMQRHILPLLTNSAA